MGKRIHELAKQWGMPTKDLLASLEKVGISGRKAQSGISDGEIADVEKLLGRASSGEVRVGDERVVGERLVTEREGDGEVTTRERIVEARVRPNVIRRRAKKVEVVERKETLPTASSEGDSGALLDLPDLPPPSATSIDDGLLPPDPIAETRAETAPEPSADPALLDLPAAEPPPVAEPEAVDPGPPEEARAPTPSAAEEPAPKKEIAPGAPTLCLLYTSPSPRDKRQSRMPSSA